MTRMSHIRRDAQEDAARQRAYDEIDRKVQDFANRLALYIDALEYMGERDMQWLSYRQAQQFHSAWSKLAKLRDELRRKNANGA